MARKYNRLIGNKKLRAKKKKTAYKTLDGYLRQVYENNKAYLNIHIEDYGTQQEKKKIFVHEVKVLLNQKNPDTGKKFTVNQAIDYVQRTSLIRSKGERGFETLITVMRDADSEAYKKLRKELGWKSKITSESSSYITTEDNYQVYRYRKNNGEVVYVKIKLSPPESAQFDIEVVPEHKYLNKLKMPKYLQDSYSNVKNKEQQQIADAAANAVDEILKKWGK